jgi:hypothetical protein
MQALELALFGNLSSPTVAPPTGLSSFFLPFSIPQPTLSYLESCLLIQDLNIRNACISALNAKSGQQYVTASAAATAQQTAEAADPEPQEEQAATESATAVPYLEGCYKDMDYAVSKYNVMEKWSSRMLCTTCPTRMVATCLKTYDEVVNSDQLFIAEQAVGYEFKGFCAGCSQ